MSDCIVRNPTPGEVEIAAEIAAIAFPNLPLEHWQQSFNTIAQVYGENYILVVEADGQLVSSMLCTPGPVYIGEGTVSHSAVGAVGTIPEYREKGCAGAMMTESVKLLKNERICTSSLWPFSYKYYRKFGWELASETRTYRNQASVFAQKGDPSATRLAKPDDLEGMMFAFDEYAHEYNCLTQRNHEWWTKIIRCDDWLRPDPDSNWGAIVLEREGEVIGYAVYIVHPDSQTDELLIDVKELIFEEVQDRRDLLAGIAKAYPDSVVTFGAPSDDMFMHELDDPRAAKCTAGPAHMFRIIDPPAAMLSLKSESHAHGYLSLSISDPVFTSGFEFGIEIYNGSISLCDFDPDHALEMSVQTLAKLYSGCLDPIQAWNMGLINVRGDMVSILPFASQIFPNLTPYRSWLEPG